jgi:hypothetical protein
MLLLDVDEKSAQKATHRDRFAAEQVQPVGDHHSAQSSGQRQSGSEVVAVTHSDDSRESVPGVPRMTFGGVTLAPMARCDDVQVRLLVDCNSALRDDL